MSIARPNINNNLSNLSINDWLEIIDSYITSEIDRTIAKRYYIDGIPMIEIGAEVGYSRKGVSNRLKKIIKIIDKYASKVT